MQSAHAQGNQVRLTKAQHALVPALPLRHLALHSSRSALGDAGTSGGASQGRRGEMGGEGRGVGQGGGGGGVRRRPESARVFGERGSKWQWTDGGTNKVTLRLSPYAAGMYRCVCVCVCMRWYCTDAMPNTVLFERCVGLSMRYRHWHHEPLGSWSARTKTLVFETQYSCTGAMPSPVLFLRVFDFWCG